MQPIQSASIYYNEQGTPMSTLFDDVYFSNESGLEETQYVFLQKNGLPQRFLNHDRRYFHIVETGFGTGLNFLLAWQNFRTAQKQAPAACCDRLYFSTFEKYPISHTDLQKALQHWPMLAELTALLLAQYPAPLAGCHRLKFDNGDVILDLWLGDVHDSMPHLNSRNSADAWFLDGFAPSKNPQMWQPELFAQMARLSRVGSTVATFTCAGLVRRGLAEVGFSVKKTKGYGRKREMCIAIFQSPFPQLQETETNINTLSSDTTELATAGADLRCTPHTINSTDLTPSTEHRHTDHRPVTIVGGGLAAICLALNLIQRGRSVLLICADKDVAQQASHNRQGALYPQLQASWTPVSMLHALAFGFAGRFYHELKQQFEFPADFCGVLTLACNNTLCTRQQKMTAEPAYGSALFTALNAAEASEMAGVALPFGGLYYPAGGWIAPQQFCQAALAYLQQHSHFEVRLNSKVSNLAWQRETGQWQLNGEDNLCQQPQQWFTDTLVLACGSHIHRFAQSNFLPLNLVRGQVSHFQSEKMAAIKTVICHQGYITPALDNLHCVGATFDRSLSEPLELEADNAVNQALVNEVLLQPEWFDDVQLDSAKAGVRTTVPDHLPVAGVIAPELYVLGGLGARGLLFAPLLAEQLAAEICREPGPFSTTLEHLVTPMRFAK